MVLKLITFIYALWFFPSVKIHLIYPDYKENAAGLQEPLGLLYLAAVLRKEGHKVKLIDMVFDSFEEVGKSALDGDLFVFSTTSILLNRSLDILRIIKKANFKSICVIGGPHATVDPEGCLKAGFDYAFYGEGEKTIMDFVKFLDKGNFESVKGLVYKKKGKVIKNPPQNFIDIDSIPFPARDLWDYDKYFKTGTTEIGMISTRGCPYNCFFCQPMMRNLFGNKMRIRSPKNVVDEIEQITKNYSYLFKGKVKIWFKDSTFTYVGKEWLKRFGNLLKEKNLKIEWGCHTRVNLVDEEMLNVMKDAGLSHISFGVESGSQRVLNFYRKGTKVEQIIKAFALCHKLKIRTFAYFMIGAPIETKEDLELTWKLIKRVKPDGLDIFTTTPYIGNDLYNYVVSNDLVIVNKASDVCCMNNEFMIKMKYLTNDDLRKFKKKVYRYNNIQLLLNYFSSWKNIKKLTSYLIHRPSFVKGYLKKSV